MPTHHAIDYIEFKVTDLSEAKRFFGAVFGWTFTDYGEAYAGIKRLEGDGEVGGMHQVDALRTNTGDGPLVIMYSAGLEATATAVESNGGVITKPVFEFPGGRRFEFTDPSGNSLAVWSDAE